MDIVVAILVFVGVVIVAALVFGGWVIVSIVRLFVRVLGGAPRAQLPAARVGPPRLPAGMQRIFCAHLNCRAANPPAARFCRRCGRTVAGIVRGRTGAVVRRVAMW